MLRHLAVHPAHLLAFVYLSGSIWGCPKAQKQKNKYFFLGVSDYFSYKNWRIDLVRGLFSSLDVGTYIPLTCGRLCNFLGLFGELKFPKAA